jgi:leader peptidase (prepilin peptidase)/N-methyltransferase
MSDADGALGLVVLPPYGWILAGVLGALWGSFFNVAIHRIGLYESVVRPASRCPRCGNPVSARDNVPILGWLWLRGKCRHCGLPISIRYPLVELAGLLLGLAIYWRFVAEGDGEAVTRAAHFLVYFAFGGTLLVISGIDLDHQIIPDEITYPAVPAFFVCGLMLRDVAVGDLLIGMVAGYGIVAVTAEVAYLVLRRDAMGYGDAKLLMLVGALLGWKAIPFAFFGGGTLGALILLPVMLVRRERLRGVEVPFGPFLAGGAMLYLFFGREVLALLAPA